MIAFLGLFGIYGGCNRRGASSVPKRELQDLAMDDMSFNQNVKVPTPPPIPEKSSKQLIVGILVTIALLAAVWYGFRAGVFKPDANAANAVVVKGDC
jgi:hypothetical protein